MDVDALLTQVVEGDWIERVSAVRSVPSEFPGREHAAVYAEVSRAFYVPKLAPHFHIIPWPEKFLDRQTFQVGYATASSTTDGFSDTTPAAISRALETDPRSLRIFRLIIGYTPGEVAEALRALHDVTLGTSAIERMETSGVAPRGAATAFQALGELLSTVVSGEGGYSVSEELQDRGFLGKTDKPDTQDGWESVRKFAQEGVPYEELLFQRFYGGAFRQLQDAGGTRKGDILEDATEALFEAHGVPYVRTVPGTQASAGAKFGITVTPAPDFILHDGNSAKGLLECKSASDGGTARDKASRFSRLRQEAQRLGGIPVIAVLEGFGWRRVNDALGPVVRDCDGRVFTLSNLDELAEVDPVRDLIGLRQPFPNAS